MVPEIVADVSVTLVAFSVVKIGAELQESSSEQEKIISAMGSNSSFFIIRFFSKVNNKTEMGMQYKNMNGFKS